MRDARRLRLLVPVALSSLALILVFQGLVPAALGDVKLTEHGGSSNCYICHTVDNPSDPMCMRCHYSIYGIENNPYVHSIKNNNTYQSCVGENSHCHVTNSYDVYLELSSSVHSGLSCGGCHAPVHISKYNGAAGAWMFVSRINQTGKFMKPNTPVNLVQNIYFFDGTNDTTKLGYSLSTLGEGTIHWAWTNITGSTLGIPSSARYIVCFNCHFLTTNPAEAGLAKQIQGKTMIAVPDFALKLSPHSITDKTLSQAYVEAKISNSNRNNGSDNDDGSGLFGSAEYMQGSLGLILGAGILMALAATRRHM
ncbi:MAG: hypothetical protein M1503_09400 [Thaumarchaeota archaeon]|nr:hypothetical protein [Nitrososphaerota archaeon]MCL5318453.1 hypothetical protein [Nitrososphaerota archaeon]